MSGLSVVWLMMGIAVCVVLVLTILLWLQWLHAEQRKAELSVLRHLVQNLGEVIHRLEREKAELAAGLRAEQGQVEQLKRRLI